MDICDGVMIGQFPDNWSDEMKEEAKQMCEMRVYELNSLCVVYTPTCGCPAKISYVLDRYPMSPKIIGKCRVCKKASLHEISDPITFYLKLTKLEYSIQDLKAMHITNGDQKALIKAYLNE